MFLQRLMKYGCLLLGCILWHAAPAQTVDLLFAGDLMQHQAQIDAARTATGYNYDSCFTLVKPEIEKADLAVANLEVTLAGKPYKGYPQFSAPDEYLKAVKDAGFDVLVTANNHCLDGGKKGLARTISMLDSLHIPFAGTYRDAAERSRRYPLLVEQNGLRIVFLNYTYGTNGLKVSPPQVVNYIDTLQIRKDIQAARRLRPDAILYRIRNASLLERINEDVTGRKLQRPVSGLLTLRIGSPAILRINSGRFSCEARSADPVQKALKAPLTRERILAQIGKTGNSPFCFSAVSVESDEDIFLPVQQLTRLRHEAFGLLEEMIRNDALRPCGCRPSAEKQEEGAQAGESHPCYSVYTETPEQFSAAAGYIAATDKPAFSRICLGTEILSTAAFRKDDFYRDLDALRQRRCEIFAALPHVMRSGDQAQFERLFKRILRLDPDGVLVRNCGQFQYLKECGFDKKIILDHNLYVFNSYAAKFWRRLGADGFTAPLEADAGDISFLSGASLEYEVYGAAPVMVSAQCLFKTSGQCRRMPQSSGLKDRFGNIFPVRSYCDFCYNVIYDRRAERSGQDLAGNSGFRPYMRRIRFSTEKAEEVRKILGCFAN